MRIVETEAQLQASVAAFLRHALPRNAVYFAVPNGIYSSAKHVNALKKQGLTPGVANLIIIHEGHAIGVELKTKKGRQSPEQLEFERRLKAAGGSYWIARSLAEVELVLAAENVIARAEIAA